MLELRGKEYDLEWQDFPPSLQRLAKSLYRQTHGVHAHSLRTRAELWIFAALEIGDALCWATKPGVFGHAYQRRRKNPTFTDALQAAKDGNKRHFLNLCRCFYDLLSTRWAVNALKSLGREDRQTALDRLRKARAGLKKTQAERFFLIVYVPRHWTDNNRAGKMEGLCDCLGVKTGTWNFDFTESSLRKRLKRFGIPLREFKKRRKTLATFREKFRASFRGR